MDEFNNDHGYFASDLFPCWSLSRHLKGLISSRLCAFSCEPPSISCDWTRSRTENIGSVEEQQSEPEDVDPNSVSEK